MLSSLNMLTILELLKTLWGHKKLLAYLLVILLYPVVYLFGDYHGHKAEKDNYYKATSQEQQKEVKDNTSRANDAIAKEGEVSKQITQLNNSKEQVKQKINDLSTNDPCTTSKLSDDELQYINGLIEAANK